MIRGSLSARGARALWWNYLGNGLRVLSQFAIGVVLARLLGPTEFGTVAMAGLVVGMGALLADLGFGVVVVQRPGLTTEDVRFVATVQVVVGAVLSATGALLAPQVASWFGQPAATPVFRAMSATFLLQSFGLTPLALLRRDLDFRGAQLIMVTSYLCGYLLVGIPMAFLGFGAWSLVAAQLTQSALSSVQAIWRHGGMPRPAYRAPTRGLLRFGAKVIGTNLANWGLSNADSVMVGRGLGATELGLYGRALALVLTPMNALTTSLQGVLFAACSRAQDDAAWMRRAWLGAMSAVAVVGFPVFLTVAALPDTVVTGVYGEGWAASAPVLVPLALAMPVMAIMALAGPVITAAGRVGVELKVSLLALALFIPALLLMGRHSAVAVAWVVLATQAVRAALMVRAVKEVVGATWGQVVVALGWPLAFAVSTAAVTAAGTNRLGGLAPVARLLTAATVAGAVLAICLLLFGRRWLAGSNAEFLRSDVRLPAAVLRLLGV